MVIKFIKVYLKRGHRDGYLAAQETWNRETRRAPGYVGCFCGGDPGDGDVLYLHFFWRSRGDLARWMAEDHDRIAALARADEHYERLEVRVLDEALSAASLPPGFLAEGTLEAADVQTWSEAYRASAALRCAVRLRVFDHLAEAPLTIAQLATSLGVEQTPLERLLLALCAMGFVERVGEAWGNTPLAERTLVEGAPACQTDMVLHNSQPEYVARVFAFGERLNLSVDTPDPQSYHGRFIKAMAATAAAGQADALVGAVDLTGCRSLLDVGGATGSYAVALCRAYPDLRALILDQPPTLPLAAAVLTQTGLGNRLRIEAHDYRTDAFPGPVDAVLISNVLRGETQELIDDILRRVYAALSPGGRVLIPDLYVEDPPANPGLRAALFGLHLREGVNGSLRRMADAVVRAGFELILAKRFTRSVVMNGMVEGRRPPHPA